MRPTPVVELELLLLSARTHIDALHARRLRAVLGRPVDWVKLETLAQRHGLTPLLYRTLFYLKSSDVPSQALAKLGFLVESNRARNRVLVEQLLRALRALHSVGVLATPYKGPALAEFLFKDFSMRQSGDIDLLVKPNEALRARRALVDEGFIPKRRISAAAAARLVNLHCEFSFTSPENQVLVELNWRFAPRYWCLPEIPDAAWNQLERLSIAGVDVPWFVPEHLLHVLCVHASKHKWSSLKWIVDIAQLLKVMPGVDWDRVINNARRAGSERMIGLGLFLASDMLDAPLPEGVWETIQCKGEVESLAAEVYEGLFAGDRVGTLTVLPFLARAAERHEMRFCCYALIPAYFVLHRLIRPGVTALRRGA